MANILRDDHGNGSATMIMQAAAVIGVAALLLGIVPASLYSDIDMSENQAQDLLDHRDGEIMAYLSTTDFPHATDQSVEVYELRTHDESKLQVQIDWATAELELTEQEPDAVLVLSPGAYQNLVRHLETELGKPGVQAEPGYVTATSMVIGSEIRVDGRISHVYKYRVLKWLSGQRN